MTMYKRVLECGNKFNQSGKNIALHSSSINLGNKMPHHAYLMRLILYQIYIKIINMIHEFLMTLILKSYKNIK